MCAGIGASAMKADPQTVQFGWLKVTVKVLSSTTVKSEINWTSPLRGDFNRVVLDRVVGEQHVVRGDRRAIAPIGIGVDVEGVGQAIIRDFPRRQRGHRLRRLRVDVEQAFEQERDHVQRSAVRCQNRVERRNVPTERIAQQGRIILRQNSGHDDEEKNTQEYRVAFHSCLRKVDVLSHVIEIETVTFPRLQVCQWLAFLHQLPAGITFTENALPALPIPQVGSGR